MKSKSEKIPFVVSIYFAVKRRSLWREIRFIINQVDGDTQYMNESNEITVFFYSIICWRYFAYFTIKMEYFR